ncbi:hypothetical protein Tco_1284783 [Tanacetum coccineum]
MITMIKQLYKFGIHGLDLCIVNVLLVKTLYEEKRLQVMIDRDLKGCYEEEELEKAVELALLCTQAQTTSRPKMSEVWKVLEDIYSMELYMLDNLDNTLSIEHGTRTSDFKLKA